MTFTASVDDAVVGTITLTVDSDHGLAADETFGDVLNTYRRSDGVKMCEMTKLAVDNTASSKPLLAALFHVVFILGSRLHDCTDLFIEVNPRHRRFYRVMLGFEPIGDVRLNTSVNAPSQLMRLEVSRIQAFIDDCHSEAPDTAVRSLYPDFLSPGEQDKIVRVLTNGVPDRPARSGRARLPFVRIPAIRKRLVESRVD